MKPVPDLEAPAVPTVATPDATSRPRPRPPPLPARRSAASPTPAAELALETAFTGGVLRRAREARGVTVQELAARTRITRHHLENVEADRYEKLPATVYLRGILTSIARELRLDGAAVTRTYLAALAASGAGAKGR